MDHFDYYYREFDEFIFPMTIHPGGKAICTSATEYLLTIAADVSGRPHVILMHERIIGESIVLTRSRNADFSRIHQQARRSRMDDI